MNVTWNPNDKHETIKLSNNNLTAIKNVNNDWGSVRAVYGVTSGKWYWETRFDNNIHIFTGVGTIYALLNSHIGSDSNGWSIYMGSRVYHNKQSLGYGQFIYVGNWISVLLDLDNGTLSFWRNGFDMGVAFDNLLGKGMIYPMCTVAYLNTSITANFGATPFYVYSICRISII